MTLFLLLFGLPAACVVAAMALKKLAAVARNQPDPAWKPTGIRQLHHGHDESKALAAAKAATQRETRRRKLEARAAVERPDRPTPAPVTSIHSTIHSTRRAG